MHAQLPQGNKMPANNERRPLIPERTPRDPALLQRIGNPLTQFIKNAALGSLSVFSSFMYWPSSFNAAAFGGEALQVIAGLCGSATNAIFNYESFLSLFALHEFRSMPGKYLTATLFSIACVAPNFFMDIVDKDGNYTDTTDITLQAVSAFLNIWVNVVGSLELMNGIAGLIKNKIAQKKEQLIAKLNVAIENLCLPKNQERNLTVFVNDVLENPALSLRQKISYYSLTTSIGLLSIPQFLAYVFISYFGMKDLSEKKFGANQIVSTLLASIAAIANAIPNAGFSIKGVNSSCKKVISLERPSLLATLFILPALFSGFTTHKAMADSLKELEYSGNTAEILNWLSNLGAALIYNLPQMLALANRLQKEKISVTEELNTLKIKLKTQINSLNNLQDIKDFKYNLPSNRSILNFFKKSPPQASRYAHEKFWPSCPQNLFASRD
jgi:hypothetical protein